MPYKSEKLTLGVYDRRRKLTDEQKHEILRIYKSGVCGTRPLAEKYGVSRKLIQIIVNPAIADKNKEHIKNNWRKYQESKEEHARSVRETRRYKQELFMEGKI